MTQFNLHTTVDLENGNPAFAKPVLYCRFTFSFLCGCKKSIGLVALLTLLLGGLCAGQAKANVLPNCKGVVYSNFVCMFVMRNHTNNEQTQNRFTGIKDMGRRWDASSPASALLDNVWFRSDLPSFNNHSKFFEMRNQRSEWAVSEVEISYKPAKNPVKITGSHTANEIFQQIWDPQLLHVQEQFYVLFLNQANHVLCWRLIGTGTGKSCVVDNKLLATIVCKTLAHNVIIAHNHPSGNLKPSKADKQLTWNIQEMLRLFDVQVLDHLIISGNGYFSFADENLIYNPQNS